jgi:hypothetical protein
VVNVVTRNINATPDQIAAAYQANQSSYATAYDAEQILICGKPDPTTGGCATSAADQAIAERLDQEALGGADFSKLAAQYSVDANSRNNGGDVGWQIPGSGNEPTEFDQAAASLQVGQITPQPVQTALGFSIIKLVGKGETLAEAAPSINSGIEQTARQQAFSAFLQQIIARTTIQINPQFGDFDPSTLTVVPPPGSVPSPAPSAGLGGLTGP